MAGREQIGAAQFDLLVGLSKFKGELDKGEQEAGRAGKAIGDELTDEAEQAVERGSAGVGKAVGAIAATAAAAFGVGLASAMDRQAQSGLLGARLGLAPDEAARAGKIAGAVYAANFGESIEDANTALQAIHTNMGGLGSFGDEQLTSMSESALTLATVMDEDVNRVIRGAGQLMRNGLAPDAEAAFDMILTAARRIPPEMQGELLDTIEEYSADWKQAGLTGERALGGITAAVQAGARNVDLAADAMREFTIQVTDGGEDAREVLTKMGIDADAMAADVSAGGASASNALTSVIKKLRQLPPSEQEMAGVALFGTMFENMGMDAIAAMDPATASMEGFTGATAAASDMLGNNAQANLDSFKRNVETAWVNLIGGKVLPIINELPAPLQTATYGIMALGGGIGGLVSQFGPMLLLLGKGGVGGAGGSGLLGSMSALGPYAIAAIAALAAAYIIVQNWDTIKRWFGDFFGWLPGAAGTVIEWFKQNWSKLLTVLTSPVSAAATATSKSWDSIKSGAASAGSFAQQKLMSMVTWVRGMPGRIASAARGMWDGIGDAFKSTINKIIDWWNGLHFPTLTIPKNVITNFMGIGGGSIGGWAVPQIPRLAEGGDIRRPGLSLVGERAPELLSMPRGARVTPLDNPGLAASGAVSAQAAPIHVDLVVDGRRFTQAVVRPHLIDVNRRTGGRGIG